MDSKEINNTKHIRQTSNTNNLIYKQLLESQSKEDDLKYQNSINEYSNISNSNNDLTSQFEDVIQDPRSHIIYQLNQRNKSYSLNSSSKNEEMEENYGEMDKEENYVNERMKKKLKDRFANSKCNENNLESNLNQENIMVVDSGSVYTDKNMKINNENDILEEASQNNDNNYLLRNNHNNSNSINDFKYNYNNVNNEFDFPAKINSSSDSNNYYNSEDFDNENKINQHISKKDPSIYNKNNNNYDSEQNHLYKQKTNQSECNIVPTELSKREFNSDKNINNNKQCVNQKRDVDSHNYQNNCSNIQAKNINDRNTNKAVNNLDYLNKQNSNLSSNRRNTHNAQSNNQSYNQSYGKIKTSTSNHISSDNVYVNKPSQLFKDNNVIVNFIFNGNEETNRSDYLSYYYTDILPVCPLIKSKTHLIRSNIKEKSHHLNDNDNTQSSQFLNLAVPSIIKINDIREYFFHCKNNFTDIATNQYSSLLRVCDFFANDYIINRIIMLEIIPRLTKHTAIIYLMQSFEKLNSAELNKENDSNSFLRKSNSIQGISINKSWFELFFNSMELVSKNLNFFFENPALTKIMLKIHKKIAEELSDKHIMFLVRQGYYYEEQSTYYLNKYIRNENIIDIRKVKGSNLIITKENILSVVLFYIYSKQETKLIEAHQIIDGSEDQITSILQNIAQDTKTLDINVIEDFIFSTSPKNDSKDRNKSSNLRFKKFNSYLLKDFLPSISLINGIVEEQVYLTSDEVTSEVFNYSIPTFLFNLERNFSNYYNEFTILLQNNKIVLTLSVFYKKSEDTLEVNLKYIENSKTNLNDDFILIPLFTKYSFLVTMSINSDESPNRHDNSNNNLFNLVNILSGDMIKIFSISNFKSNYCENNHNTIKNNDNKSMYETDISISINVKTCFIHSSMVDVISQNFYTKFYNDIELKKLNKNIFGNVIKDLSTSINNESRYNLSLINSCGIDCNEANKRLMIAVNTWLSDQSNISTDIYSLIEFINWKNVSYEVIFDFLFKISNIIYNNDILKSKYFEKVFRKLDSEVFEVNKDKEIHSNSNVCSNNCNNCSYSSANSITAVELKKLCQNFLESFISKLSRI